MCVYVHKYIHIYTYIYTNVCIDVSYHACMHACMHACIHACIHTYIHTYIHACTHTHICARSLARVQQVWKAKGDACGVTLHDLVEAGLALFAALAECKAEDGVLAQLGRVAFVPGVHPQRVPLPQMLRDGGVSVSGIGVSDVRAVCVCASPPFEACLCIQGAVARHVSALLHQRPRPSLPRHGAKPRAAR